MSALFTAKRFSQGEIENDERKIERERETRHERISALLPRPLSPPPVPHTAVMYLVH